MNDHDSEPVVSADTPLRAEPPLRLGPERYERRQVVGVGGMGRVSVVWDRALGREVALKEPAPGHAAALAEEARRAAALDHPGIVPVFDVGVGPDGSPWYTMRLLRGQPLEDALEAERDLAGRLGWLRATLAACEAVAYAHSRGVIHRDLKPANLLLGELGETYVADWGLASDPGARDGAGTPGYRAPEVEAGESADTRSDVYALGGVLFRVCAGVPPGRGAVLPPQTPPELAAIVARAMALAPSDRYPDARALAEDLAAYLDGRRVSAHDYSPWELLRRLVAAWRAPLAVATVAALVLLGTATYQHLGTVRERDRARAAESAASLQLARALTAQATQALRAERLGEAEVLAAHAARLLGAAEPRVRALAVGVIAAASVATPPAPLGAGPLPRDCDDPRLSGDRILCLGEVATSAWSLDRQPRGAFPGRHVDGVAFDGRVALVEPDGRVSVDGVRLPALAMPAGRLELLGDRVWMTAGSLVSTIRVGDAAWQTFAKACPEAERLIGSAAGADGRIAAICSGGTVFVSDGGALRPTAVRVQAPVAIDWLGEDLMVGTVGGDVTRVGPDGAEKWRTTTSGATLQDVQSLGATGVLARGPQATWILDPSSGSLRARLPPTRAAVVTSEDTLVALTRDGTPARWRLPARVAASRLSVSQGLSSLSLSPDGDTLAVGGGSLVFWGVEDGALTRPRLPEGVVKSITWAPDGSRVFAPMAGPNDTFDVGIDGAVAAFEAFEGAWRRFAWLRSGLRVGLSYGAGGRVIDDDGPVAAPWPAGLTFYDLGVGPAGDAVALLDGEGGLWWLGGGPTRAERRAVVPGARAVDLGPDGQIVVATGDALVRLDDTGAERARWALDQLALDVAWSPDGAWIATGNVDGTADVHDARTGALIAVLSGHADRVAALEFSHDSTWLATASWDRTARRWALGPLRAPPPPEVSEARWGLTLAEAVAAMGG